MKLCLKKYPSEKCPTACDCAPRSEKWDFLEGRARGGNLGIAVLGTATPMICWGGGASAWSSFSTERTLFRAVIQPNKRGSSSPVSFSVVTGLGMFGVRIRRPHVPGTSGPDPLSSRIPFGVHDADRVVTTLSEAVNCAREIGEWMSSSRT